MNARSRLISKLQRNTKFRAAYIRSKLNLLIPSQLRALRLKGQITQKQLADEAEMMQPRISAMERTGEIKFSLETLIRMAAAHKVGLQVRFVPFSELLQWENGYSQDNFDVVRLDEDERFLDPADPPAGQLEAGGAISNDLAVDQKKGPRSEDNTRAAAAGSGLQCGGIGGM